MVMEKLALDVGTGILTGLGQDGVKLAARKMFTKSNPKDPVIYFGFWCSFIDEHKPTYDNARDALSEAFNSLSRKGNSLAEGKNSFDFDVTWKTLEDCGIPSNEPWENDALLKENDENILEDDSSPECALGFAIWLWPSSLSKRKDLMMSAFRAFRKINSKLQDDRRMPKMKNNSFAFIRANTELCLKIHSRLHKKFNVDDDSKMLLGRVDIAPLADDIMIMTVPLRDITVAESLADSFSIWGTFKR